MFNSKRFLLGFFLASIFASIFYLVIYLLLLQVGEVNLDKVVKKQLINKRVLYVSGINQSTYQYKIKLFDTTQPEIVTIGSSRAMQVRNQFFNKSFINLGGINNVAELESMITELVSRKQKPKLVLVFIDPWWVNKDFAGNGGITPLSNPSQFSLPLAISAISTLRQGNWLTKMLSSDNLGIHSILTDEGFSHDGSYHYTTTLSGQRPTEDQNFSNTLWRISNSNARFNKADTPDSKLVSRMCSALQKLDANFEHVVVIAPPFSSIVWKSMAKGGYEYIDTTNNEIAKCIGSDKFHSFVSGDNIPENTDCEFIDGFHGGDVTYARVISIVATKDAHVHRYTDSSYLDQFINENSGLAGGTTMRLFGIKEIDFLMLGCVKTSHRL
jgi:hypothetical protein